jgi:hypothetical protein
MSGVCIASLNRSPLGKYTHLTQEDWTITSNVPLEDLAETPVLEKALPGLLGSYFYPSDAVFSICKVKNTTKKHFEEVVAREEQRLKTRNKRFVQVNALTFESVGDLEEEVIPSEDDEEEIEDEDEDDEPQCAQWEESEEDSEEDT